MDIFVNDYFSDGEMGVLLMAINQFIYDNPRITDEQYELAVAAQNKLTRNVI